jgi:hypothetical protein
LVDKRLTSFSDGAICTIDRFGGKGAQILDNNFTNGAALLGRTKSSGAVIRGNTWTDTATHTLEVQALQNFMEGPVEIAGVTIDGNSFIRSTDNTTSPVSAGPNATGVSFTNNKISPSSSRSESGGGMRWKTDDVMRTLMAAALAALAAPVHGNRGFVLEPGPVPPLFPQWKKLHRRIYASVAEEEHRGRLYAADAAMVAAHNERAARGLETFTMAVNQWSDLTPTEFSELMGLQNNLTAFNSSGDEVATWLPEVGDEPKGDGAAPPPPPSSLDWRTKGAVTGVKDQVRIANTMIQLDSTLTQGCRLDDVTGPVWWLLELWSYRNDGGCLVPRWPQPDISQRGAAHPLQWSGALAHSALLFGVRLLSSRSRDATVPPLQSVFDQLALRWSCHRIAAAATLATPSAT